MQLSWGLSCSQRDNIAGDIPLRWGADSGAKGLCLAARGSLVHASQRGFPWARRDAFAGRVAAGLLSWVYNQPALARALRQAFQLFSFLFLAFLRFLYFSYPGVWWWVGADEVHCLAMQLG
jgi:hypothetical protein